MGAYDTSTYIGMSKGVDGTPCQQWKAGTSINDTSTFCVTEAGALLDLVRCPTHIRIVVNTTLWGVEPCKEGDTMKPTI